MKSSDPRQSPAPKSRQGWPPWPLLCLLAGLELAWFIGFESIALPNFPTIHRWQFLARAFPEIIPGITFGQSYLGLAIEELSHVENLPQRLPIILAAVLIAASALGLGGLILRGLGIVAEVSIAERWGSAFGLGTAGLGVLTLVFGRLEWLAPWPVRIGLGLIAAAEALCLVFEWKRRGQTFEKERVAGLSFGGWLPAIGFGTLAGPFLVLMILGSMLPAIDFDAIEYHLQGPKEFYQAGRITFLPHNVYTSMPLGVEMLHLLGMEVLDDWWWGALVGQLLVALFNPFAGLMIALVARRFGSPRAAWFAAVVYLTTPWIYRVAVLPYVEGPLCYYHAAIVWAVARAWSNDVSKVRTRFWGLAGLFAGAAMACKYPALVSAVIPVGLLALTDTIRRGRIASVAAFAAGWGAVMLPWLVRNVIDTGNPVYPLAYNVFGGRYWNLAMDRKWSNAHGPRAWNVGLFWAALVDVTARSDWQSPLYAALAPLAFLRRASKRFVKVLGIYVLYLFLTWWLFTHRLDRFWLPILVPLAILAGLGADWTRGGAWSAILGSLFILAFVSNLSFSTTPLTALTEWTGDLTTLRVSVPGRLNPPLATVDRMLPADAKLLLVGQAAVFHVNHPIIYNTVFDEETFETLVRGHSPADARAALKRLGITHVYVDWHEIDRYRSPGNYGFTPFVTTAEFDRLVKAGVLEQTSSAGETLELYKVK